MKFTLIINCDNAAFGDDICDTCDEVARILRDAANKLSDTTDSKLLDSDGNSVGEFYFNTLVRRGQS